MNRDFLYLIWKDPRTRRNFTIGKLSREDSYYTFKYEHDSIRAEEYGWQKLSAFPDDKKLYRSKTMFPVFSSRLPDRRRKGIEKILEKYGLTEFDKYELLKKSGARLPIDTYEFIDPIFPEDETVQRDFYVMGIRHYASCNGENCSNFTNIEIGNSLFFEEEPNNEYDPLAIRIINKNGEHLGYVPRYYNEEIVNRLHKGMTYSCTVIEVNLNASDNCSECIKVQLVMPNPEENS